MKRTQELINQLKEQLERQESPAMMLATAQLLEAELSRLAGQAAANRGSAKVAVMMPSAMKMYAGQQATSDGKGTGRINTVSKETVVKEGVSAREGISKERERSDWPFNPLTDIPTLAHQPAARELNDVIGSNGSSLNDKLKADVVELAHALNGSPVRDLKKAIGVNDRYVFISELFRGDEAMYERSIKTINGFRILPEAEYWMQRELKVKLGWDENREATRHFYQLVKRRFS
ncbi:MAG: hypothetical protein Q8927_12240 [Bacteroidota bacterium]|nr:hypothetical protein [Bacteroidota bacterium]MDP4216962.1 hypothetical protein [Bacteroidota bacterium]MDP4244300.1 hypothetical protein [Bacteroidota bacterium]MDP4252770.1 hypothetical protein [Bacteroidota bacterium]MDP4257545.1 hypothetical protein [Bacteroidota bacterium]